MLIIITLLAAAVFRGDFLFCNDTSGFRLYGKENRTFILSAVWLLSFWFGGVVGWLNRISFGDWLIHLSLISLPAFNRYFLLLAPCLLAFMAVVFKCRFLIYSIVAAEGIGFGTILIGVLAPVPIGGWLIAGLLLFPKFLLLILQFLYWRTCLSLSVVRLKRWLIPMLVAFLVATIMMQEWIVPIITVVLDHL